MCFFRVFSCIPWFYFFIIEELRIQHDLAGQRSASAECGVFLELVSGGGF